jgi:spermidine/putrescine transport system ATP-binding protein
VGSPRELYHSPATPFVASFVGETNRWQGQAASSANGAVAVSLPSGAVVQGQGSGAAQALAFVRPEAVALAQDQSSLANLPNRFEGRVSAVLFDGAASSLLIDTAGFDQPVRAVLPQAGPLAGIEVGAPIHVGWTADAMKVFAA